MGEIFMYIEGDILASKGGKHAKPLEAGRRRRRLKLETLVCFVPHNISRGP
jgi:hypothetical protein